MTWRTDAASTTVGALDCTVTREGSRWRYVVQGTIGGVELHATGYERDEDAARTAATRLAGGMARVGG